MYGDRANERIDFHRRNAVIEVSATSNDAVKPWFVCI